MRLFQDTVLEWDLDKKRHLEVKLITYTNGAESLCLDITDPTENDEVVESYEMTVSELVALVREHYVV